ncbi:Alkane hydroxylase MAH1 [Sesamum alatum]|uniref:Alkane hydroxylase MAH1 n=1 Tax=Sesamum alatum TaxID=300844 RepID=A0AAE1Z0E0_9LAMI|nr:Alkane hydroxylase MAH1 [Sesamum alatum]
MELVSETGMEVDLQELFQRFAFDGSCILVLGHDPISLCMELPHLPHDKAFADIGKQYYTAYTPSSYLEAAKQNDTVAMDPAGREDFDVLSCYMRAVERNGDDASNIPQELWRDNMLNLIFAGKDTISTTLTWFFWLLATHPAEEEKI